MSTSQGFIFLKKKNVNGESKWFEDGDEENDGKYVGEIENGKPNGHGTWTSTDGTKYVGEWKDGGKNTDDIITYDFEVIWIGEFRNDQPWNVTSYDKDVNIVGKYVNGEHNPFY